MKFKIRYPGRKYWKLPLSFLLLPCFKLTAKMEDELTPLIGESLSPLTRTKRIQKSLAKHLESNRVHLCAFSQLLFSGSNDPNSILSWMNALSVVIGLTTLDALFVLSDLSYDFLKDPKCICNPSLCPSEDPDFLEWFEFASIIITGNSPVNFTSFEAWRIEFITDCFRIIESNTLGLFLTEIPLALFAFGSKYYTTVEHAWCELFSNSSILFSRSISKITNPRKTFLSFLFPLKTQYISSTLW